MTLIEEIVFLKREIAESENYIAECKKALRTLAQQAWDEGLRDIAGQYEVRETRSQPLNTTTFRNTYPSLYEGTVELMRDQFIPEVTKASITRYLEYEQFPQEEISRIIGQCSEESDKVSYNIYAKRGVDQ